MCMALIVLGAGPAIAQEKLADMVAAGGYDWLIGKWTATTDDGDTIHFDHQWGLDKHIVHVTFAMAGIEYRGMIIYIPWREEIVQVGADNRGGTWKGTWTDEYGSAVYRSTQTKADGTTEKMALVYTRDAAGAIKVAVHGLDSDGWRVQEPSTTLTFKPRGNEVVGAGSSGGFGGYYQSLGDLVGEGGYDWMAGNWASTFDDGREVNLGYEWIVNKHAVAVDVDMGRFKYYGLIMFVPSQEQVIQIGADNLGGAWDGTWSQGYDGLSHRMQHTKADGTRARTEHLYIPGNKDSFTVKEYTVGTDGYRANEPQSTEVFKRRKANSAN